jgi:amino acid adenylation domain-containing protein
LFDAAILLQNIHDKSYISHTQPNMIFSFLQTAEKIEGVVEYNAMRYNRGTMARLVNHFKHLLEQLILNVNIPVSEIEVLKDEEKRQLLVDFNNTGTNYPLGKTIDGLFDQQDSRTTNAIALTYESRHLTYGRLKDRADRLASYLRQQSIKPEEPVTLMADNTHDVIVALLAILKAGGSYVPLNFEYPEKRKKFILTDTQANLLLTNYKRPCPYAPTVIDLEDAAIYRHGTKIRQKHGSNHLAYIMYTSGSTGNPKGVMALHKGVIRLVKNNGYMEFKPGDAILLTGALEFDASTFEIWGPLLNGLPLHLVGKDTLLNHIKLKQALRRNRVTTIWMTSSLFNQMLDLDIEVFAGLENFLVGGDVLSPPHINRVRRRYPALNVINGYGPTENTTFSTTYPLGRDDNESKSTPTPIPIGKPIANTSAYIVDRNNHLLPPGVEGELLVGGDGTARGYLNNPELTAEKFKRAVIGDSSLVIGETKRAVISPSDKLSKSTHDQCPMTNHRFYFTGDLAAWRPDGNILFLGRIDRQVKIRGFRIQLEEIQSCLLTHDLIKDALVIAGKSPEIGEKYLCAYIVPGEAFELSGLRDYLSRHLPQYMIPAYFISIEKIPLTIRGKIDQEALPKPGTGETMGTSTYIPPRDFIEETLVRQWSKILKIEKEKIGIEHNFFDMGGNSINVITLVSKIHKEFGIHVPVTQIFEKPEIKEISRCIKLKRYDEKPLVLFNQSSSTKVFCFPPGTAHGVSYHALASCLGEYSLYSFDFIEEENRLSRYMEIIAAAQPQGPYVFLGWSGGGALAFEMAGALERHGGRVSDIIMADCVWDGHRAQQTENVEFPGKFIAEIEENLERMGVEFLKDKVLQKVSKYLSYIRHLKHLEKIKANVHYIFSEEPGATADENRAIHWGKFTTRELFTYNGYGEHHNMFDPGPVEKNAGIIRRILRDI